uniref:Poly [ADP-ribose] polymerase n=1 Tax=Lotharella oceanica TaxID=641309 RepID=A0A7S2TP74_9EUKA
MKVGCMQTARKTKRKAPAKKSRPSAKKTSVKKAVKKSKTAKVKAALKKGKTEAKSMYIEEVTPVEEDKVEDECPLKGQSKVYSDASGFFTATLQSASRLERQAKFYIIQLLKGKDAKFHVWTRWGRVGLSGVSKMMGPYDTDTKAKNAFAEKFKKKTGNTWDKRGSFTPKPGKYTLMGHDGADEAEEGAGDYDGMMARLRNHPNEGRELGAQADEMDGERVRSVRTHKWQYYVDDGVDGKSTNWYDYDLEASDVVDFAFKDWRRNPAVNVRAIKSGIYTYSVNFNKMEQTNIEHRNHTKRAIRRVVFKTLKRSGSFLGFE